MSSRIKSQETKSQAPRIKAKTRSERRALSFIKEVPSGKPRKTPRALGTKLVAAVFSMAMICLMIGVTVAWAGLSADEFIAQIKSQDATVRLAAVNQVTALGNDVVAPLGELLADTSRGVAKSAFQALAKLTAHRSRPKPGWRERRKFNDELLKIVEGSTTTLIKQHALRFLSQTAGKREVEKIAALLSNPQLFEPARWTLERIPDKKAGEALLAHLDGADETQQVALILTLGSRGDAFAVARLHELASSETTSVRLAAYRALVDLEDDSVAPMILAAAADTIDEVWAAGARGSLELADRLRAGNAAGARDIYRKLLALSLPAHYVRAAIVGLGKTGEAADVEALVSRLKKASPVTRSVIGDALAQIPGADVTADLVARYHASRGMAVKKALIQAVVARDSGAAEPLLHNASRASNLSMRSFALAMYDRIDSPENRKTLLKAAKHGSAPASKAALHALAVIADGLQITKPSEARELYDLVLESPADVEDTRRAMNGIAALKATESANLIAPLFQNPALRTAAARVYVDLALALARDGSIQRAQGMLIECLNVISSPSLFRSVGHKLSQTGVDVKPLGEKVGFVQNWWVSGPFPNKGRRAERRAYFPEKGIDFAQTKTFKKYKITAKWQPLTIEDLPPIVPFGGLYGNERYAGYAYTELEVPEDMPVQFRIGSDDGVVCWVNGWKVHKNLVGRGLAIDADLVDVYLNKGKNTILMKVINLGGDWEACLRICDVNGTPLDLRQFEVMGE